MLLSFVCLFTNLQATITQNIVSHVHLSESQAQHDNPKKPSRNVIDPMVGCEENVLLATEERKTFPSEVNAKTKTKLKVKRESFYGRHLIVKRWLRKDKRYPANKVKERTRNKFVCGTIKNSTLKQFYDGFFYIFVS